MKLVTGDDDQSPPEGVIAGDGDAGRRRLSTDEQKNKELDGEISLDLFYDRFVAGISRFFAGKFEMSCNGCRILRKGCSESCILRPCLQWIETPEAQAHATVFVAKFFGRAGLMSFISSVPENQRPALFESLLFEACGRTVNPVNGAVGLLWTGNWHVCQTAVETVLRGGTLQPISDVLAGILTPDSDDASEAEVVSTSMWKLRDSSKWKASDDVAKLQPADLNLCLKPAYRPEKRRPTTPSVNSEESGTTSYESGAGDRRTQGGREQKLLNLFA
ncbi:hypothetical protein HHK36_031015 [Tetracentron sinense]|uniref:LOB domain-containing protein n=1 Tax=Tetracentron sinense TaxID=13715 RepID=A0A834Y8N0_TETSI|nr:hypothetical protein HHK36_031015 [Tetracentron sinense]